ncbi:hypothetical protein [Nitrososphaera sp.]|uniref:hypothetical protein n=1 Tax=Nitrososphaera sp. TaxID=1971748 RepID=UPI00307ED061
MKPADFERFLEQSGKSLQPGRSDSDKVKTLISWCRENGIEEVILRLSSEENGGWSRNYALDFTTERVIVSRKSFLTKFADLGFVAGLAPYPYLLTTKNMDPARIRKQANLNPEELILSENFERAILYSDIDELSLRKGWETTVANMMGRAIVSNFLTITASAGGSGKTYRFTLPVNKNGPYGSIRFWLSVALPMRVIEK